jgi:fatty-acyl-CoA synthase
MQDRPLTIPLIFHRMEEVFGQISITSVRGDTTTTMTYAQWAEKVRRLANALINWGLTPGTRVATLCSNSIEHLALYYAVPCGGLVLHTINHRLSTEHIEFMIQDAGAKVLVVDADLVSTLPSSDALSEVEHIVVIGEMSNVTDERVVAFESLLATSPYQGDFVVDDERLAASICYTSGTTGLPKGVVYSHRSVVLVALMSLAVDTIGLSVRDVVMPIVPMFHANAWGLPYAATFAGADLVLPGPGKTGRDLVDLIEKYRVSVSAAVVSVWRDMLAHVEGRDLASLRRPLTGGGPLPTALAKRWFEATGSPLVNSWGMTELGPLGTVAGLRRPQLDDPVTKQLGALSLPGTPGPLVRLRLGATTSPSGSSGELEVSGPTVASDYFGSPGTKSFTADGWLKTGDVATLEPSGVLRITDRLKDVIKSGGEWISSLELEDYLMDHPGVAEAAVIGVADGRWDERPVAFVVARHEVQVTEQEILRHLSARVAKFWLPDRVLFEKELPKTSTGKVAKMALRERFELLTSESLVEG